MLQATLRPTLVRSALGRASRRVSTLPAHPEIYVFTDPRSHTHKLLSLLSTNPPKPELALGTTSELPPRPGSFTDNPRFLSILQTVIAENARNDPDVISQAQSMASIGGAVLGSGGVFFPHQPKKRTHTSGGGGGAGGNGAGGASAQGGMGGGGVGGFIHVSSTRNPPDFGRIAAPEDIFGSIEVDSHGQIVEGKSSYQESGTFRIVTREGILGLSPFLQEKLVQKLKEIEGTMQ
ncbi:hypothetical protein L228DRAFT_251484 [Xylona heveae TC161]|uniref:Uncharacterized protein n=1 Tax=Xylona heveae (strain CBS 132557 / TC161) TaxID=1328760 RepID=A0A164ZD57_XYLHT|nr:hypothetical protein L228DRAFT_251484 [Xylona heveae TC161]KZF18951.1 hypothetical protein L228DRAFT_251484 [Xylona heveae TC161]